MTKDQKYQLQMLEDHKYNILVSLQKMEEILDNFFPKQKANAAQHWIPQIYTALKEKNKWLNRGSYTYENTLSEIINKED